MKFIKQYLKEIYGSFCETEEEQEEAARPPGYTSSPFDAPPKSSTPEDPKAFGGSVVQTKKAEKPKTADTDTWATSDVGVAKRDYSDKPKYKGHFVGQQVNLGQQSTTKNVSWDKKPPETGRGFGRVATMQDTNTWVWDGKDWIRPGAFSTKFPKR